jgi:hypothetical protein
MERPNPRAEKEFLMINEMTKNPLRVKPHNVAGPYLMLPMSQVPSVCEILDRNSIHYWVDTFGISFDGKPPTTVINFGRKENADRIQALLDEAG